MNFPTRSETAKEHKKLPLYAFIIGQLFACTNCTNTEIKDKVVGQHDFGVPLTKDEPKGGNTSDHPLHINTLGQKDKSTSVDTNQQIIDYNTAVSDSIYKAFLKKVHTKPTSISNVSSNPEVLGMQISHYADQGEILMMIAQSPHCNTSLLRNIAVRLNSTNQITDERKKKLIQLFKTRLNNENATGLLQAGEVERSIYYFMKKITTKSR